MNRRISGVIGVAASLSLAAVVMPGGQATATPAASPESSTRSTHKDDDRPDAREAKRRAERQRAVELVATGKREVKTRGGSRVVQVAPGQWVEYGTQETAQLLTFLIDFGDTTDTRFPDAPATGPRAGEIPEPGADDNSTYWKPSFDRQHFLDMFFNGLADQGGESFRDIYNEMSSGRFDVQGDVSEWVTVPHNAASYGETESNTDMTRFVSDAATAWVEQQRASGKSDAEIANYLKQYDVWDRFDHDGDGVYDEADGYIDHFQAIHAGEGEEAGAPSWAIWSHRWAVNPSGTDGPEGAEFGGIQIGDTGLWIRDYTTEPENGGLGVFAHEFAHDLGLPDYYDTAGGENGTGFWNLMSSGSWMNHGGDAIGTTPNHMGAHEKLQLGWLDYARVDAGESATVGLGPSFHATKRPQAVLVNLPTGEKKIDVGPAASGNGYFYSGNGDYRTATVTSPEFTVPPAAQLTAKVNYEIETDWDYAYAEMSTDGGETFTPVPTNLSTNTDPYNQNDGEGITGSTDGQWVDLTADLTSYAGEQALLRFRMFNDASVHELGFKVDDISVGDALSTGIEDGAPGWTRDGFLTIEDGSYTVEYDHYYLAENRQYAGYDTTLAEGPYNFGWTASAPNTVERFPYQNGLLVWYVNGLFTDNNTSQHPGGGEALPVDAHAAAMRWSDGAVVRNRIQSYDATFGLQATDPLSLHRERVTSGGTQSSTLQHGSLPAAAVFDDTDPMAYYDPANLGGSVIVGGTGTSIRVVEANDNRGLMTVEVN